MTPTENRTSTDGTEVSAGSPAQLQMLWPEDRLNRPLAVQIPHEYELRTFQPQDTEAYLALMHRAGFDTFGPQQVTDMLAKVLPNGFFLIVHSAGGQVVATAMATHNPMALHPFGGELGWVAAHPDHSGRGLGLAVCSAAVNRMISAGYSRIYLRTDDFRLAAIKVYLKMGFAPLMFSEDMPRRWQAVLEQLKWKGLT